MSKKPKSRKDKKHTPKATTNPVVVSMMGNRGFDRTKVSEGVIKMSRPPKPANTTEAMRWEDLHNLHESMAKGFVEFKESIQKNNEIVALAKQDDDIFKSVVATGYSDVEVFVERLNECLEEYKDKFGKINEEDLPLYYDLGIRYETIFSSFSQLALKTATEITNKIASVVSRVSPEESIEAVTEKTFNEAANQTTHPTEPQKEEPHVE